MSLEAGGPTGWPEDLRALLPPGQGLLPPAASASWATPEEAAQAAWILIRPGFMVALFLVGWAGNVTVFSNFRVDYMTALDLAKDELISPQRLVWLAAIIGMVLGLFRTLMQAEVPLPIVLWGILFAYAAFVLAIMGRLPGPLARATRWRIPLGRALRRCFFPFGLTEVPFVDVLVADGLTSLAKVFFDLAVGSCVAVGTLDPSQGLGGLFFVPPGRNETLGVGAEAPSSHLGVVMEQCKRSRLPYLAWALPFLIRAQQCLIVARHSPDQLSRDTQKVNFLKYMSALPVIGFALCYELIGSQISWTGADPGTAREDFEALWALAAVVNSVFSFFWDLTMDWGLLQAGGLRPVLLFKQLPCFYQVAIVLNLLGRTLWSLRWSPQATAMMGSFFLPTLQQAAEVLRRCFWNLLRVEWECIKRNLHRVNEKQFAV